MHDLMNNASSHNIDFDQFHMKVLYIMTLLCFMYQMNQFKRCCFDIKSENLPETIRISFVLMENKRSHHKPINLTLKILISIH
jgi:hypothetical protein